jgi:hypothetical protein
VFEAARMAFAADERFRAFVYALANAWLDEHVLIRRVCTSETTDGPDARESDRAKSISDRANVRPQNASTRALENERWELDIGRSFGSHH